MPTPENYPLRNLVTKSYKNQHSNEHLQNEVTVELGQNATLRCSHDQAIEQTVYVDFQALDDASENTVLEFDRSAAGQIEIKYHPSNRFITDGRSIKLFNAQLSDEGTYTCTIRPTGSNKVVIKNPLVVNTKVRKKCLKSTTTVF